jgi:hypothetical protein
MTIAIVGAFQMFLEHICFTIFIRNMSDFINKSHLNVFFILTLY